MAPGLRPPPSQTSGLHDDDDDNDDDDDQLKAQVSHGGSGSGPRARARGMTRSELGSEPCCSRDTACCGLLRPVAACCCLLRLVAAVLGPLGHAGRATANKTFHGFHKTSLRIPAVCLCRLPAPPPAGA